MARTVEARRPVAPNRPQFPDIIPYGIPPDPYHILAIFFNAMQKKGYPLSTAMTLSSEEAPVQRFRADSQANFDKVTAIRDSISETPEWRIVSAVFLQEQGAFTKLLQGDREKFERVIPRHYRGGLSVSQSFLQSCFMAAYERKVIGSASSGQEGMPIDPPSSDEASLYRRLQRIGRCPVNPRRLRRLLERGIDRVTALNPGLEPAKGKEEEGVVKETRQSEKPVSFDARRLMRRLTSAVALVGATVAMSPGNIDSQHQYTSPAPTKIIEQYVPPSQVTSRPAQIDVSITRIQAIKSGDTFWGYAKTQAIDADPQASPQRRTTEVIFLSKIAQITNPNIKPTQMPSGQNAILLDTEAVQDTLAARDQDPTISSAKAKQIAQRKANWRERISQRIQQKLGQFAL